MTIGGLFVGHGMQKLRGWLGGPGLEGTRQMMDGLEPAGRGGATLSPPSAAESRWRPA